MTAMRMLRSGGCGMSTVVAKVIYFGQQPSTLLVLLGLVGLVLIGRGWRRAGLWCAGIGVGALAFILAVPVTQWMLLPLEDWYPPVREMPAHVDGIITLGGAVDPMMTEARGAPAMGGGAERMMTFVALARDYPDAELAFAGGASASFAGSVKTATGSRLSEADVARMVFAQLGLTRPVVFDDQSHNTYENAVFLRERVQPRPGSVWVLLTSAVHMPRAVASFRRAGWDVLPWPVGYMTGHTLAIQYENALPVKLGELDMAVHEWFGLLAYRLLGRA